LASRAIPGDISQVLKTSVPGKDPEGLASLVARPARHPGLGITAVRCMLHQIPQTFAVGRMPGASKGKNEPPTALGISFIPGRYHLHIGFGGKGGIAHDHDCLSPVRGLKVAEHPPKKLIFLLVSGMTFRPDDLKIHGKALVLPGHHKHDDFDAEEPGMVLAHSTRLSSRNFWAPFVYFAAVGNKLEHFIFRLRQSLYGFLRKPLEEQLEAPVAGV